ncbi:unnamed protein product [Somion occarium]|uniref:SMAD/FHA domain-containing protein n=1 Tax=Somion occarium TaxID=3059160 RepID=A0ABP1DWK8_9APHY
MAMDPLSLGSESPPARQSMFGSFLRGRPRGTSQSHPSPPPDIANNNTNSRDSPSPSGFHPPALTDSNAGHRRRPAASISPHLQASHSTNNATASVAGPFSHMLRRRRSAGALASTATPQVPAVAVARTTVGTSSTNVNGNQHPIPLVNGSVVSHRIRLVPHLDSRRSLRFDPICRDVREGDAPLRIGRFTDRSGMGLAAANANGSNKLAFKSKVVSRAHAEIWVESGGKFFIKDTKSSSGTFLNHVRLSAANSESRPNELKDGDLLQLGVDYQGGTEDIYKCVKIKIEVNREWQAQNNPFNANALKQLKAIAIAANPTGNPKKTVSAKSALPDCCICLFAETINQALFIAPCSHTFHYKCIRPLLETHHPAFSCPLCRTFANLEDDVEVEVIEQESLLEAASVIAALNEENARSAVDRVDPGAETEVEAEPGRAPRRRSVVPPLPNNVVDLTEDRDAEMVDLALPSLPENEPDMMGQDDDLDVDNDSVEYVPPAASSAAAAPANRSAEYLSEGEGSGVGMHDAEGGSSEGSGRGSAEVINGKRKR